MGKEQMANGIVNILENPQFAFPTFDQLKVLLAQYDEDLAPMDSMTSSQSSEQIALLQQQVENLKNILNKASETNTKLAEENLKLKQVSIDSDMIMIEREHFHSVLNYKQPKNKRKQHEKRRSSLL